MRVWNWNILGIAITNERAFRNLLTQVAIRGKNSSIYDLKVHSAYTLGYTPDFANISPNT